MKSFLFALYQLTRLPLPAVPFDEKACGRSAIFFPAVGCFLGTVLAVLAWASTLIFPVQVRSALLVAGMVVLTGGIHLDGFMDSIDGLFSGRPGERKLEIMRDSKVGAFGAIGVVCLLLFKYTLFLGMPVETLVKILPVVPALSRWGMSLAITVFPYAREEGLGKIYASYTGIKELVGATTVAAAIGGTVLGIKGICLIALSGLVTYLVGKKITGELGGLTGDIYGLINELLEVILLAAAYPMLKENNGV